MIDESFAAVSNLRNGAEPDRVRTRARPTILGTDVQITSSTKMQWTATGGAPITPSVVRYEPEPGDVMAIDGAGVNIVKTMRIPRAGTAVAWRFIVRG